MNDAQKRALRTLIQAALAVLATGVLAVALPGDFGKWATALTALLTVVFSAIQNALEDNGTIPTVLKGTGNGEA